MLAAAVRAAREEGLPLPVPVTLRYADAEAGREDAVFQEQVLEHLGVHERVLVDADDARDLLSPAAQALLRRHGPVHPAASVTSTALWSACRGTTLLTGEGGDEVLGPQRGSTAYGVVRRRVVPGRAMARGVAVDLAPRGFRRRLLRRAYDHEGRFAWLRPAAREDFLRRLVTDETARPLHWGRALRLHVRRRFLVTGLHNMEVLAAEQGVALRHPLLEPAFVEPLAARGGALGWDGRGHALTDLFGDLLPRDVLTRRGKATFNRVTFGPRSPRLRRRPGGGTGRGWTTTSWTPRSCGGRGSPAPRRRAHCCSCRPPGWPPRRRGRRETTGPTGAARRRRARPRGGAPDAVRGVAAPAAPPGDLPRLRGALGPRRRPRPRPRDELLSIIRRLRLSAPGDQQKFGGGTGLGGTGLGGVRRGGVWRGVVRRGGVRRGMRCRAWCCPGARPPPRGALERVLRRWPRGTDAACLRRSLVLGHVLRDREPALALGVLREDGRLRAHAWLVVDGVALDTGAAAYSLLDAPPPRR